MLDRYGVVDEVERETLFALAREAGRRGWWREYDHMLLAAIADLISLEDDAAEIRIFEVIRIPGLLQTPDYARAMLAGGVAPPRPYDADRLVSVRMRRQKNSYPRQSTAAVDDHRGGRPAADCRRPGCHA